MRQIRFPRLIKAAAAAALVLVVALILAVFLRRSLGGPEAEKRVVLDEPKVATSEKIEHLEIFKGEKENFRITADKHFLGQDGLYHLEGNVLVESLRSGEGEDVVLTGRQATYDEKMRNFQLFGEARFQQEDLSVGSASFNYDRKSKTLRSGGRVRFSSDRMAGSAQKMVYTMKGKTIRLDREVEIELKPDETHSLPIRITGDAFQFSNNGKRGTVVGRPLLFHGRDRAQADRIQFSLLRSGERLKQIILSGNVRADMVSENADPVDDQSAFRLYQSKREIKAEELRMEGYSDQTIARSLLAEGSCSFKFSAADGRSTMIEGESVEFVLDREGRLQDFRAVGRARIEQRTADRELSSLLAGETLTMAGQDKVLTASGKKEAASRMVFGGFDVTAEKISLHPENRDFEAAGKMKVIMSPGEEVRSSLAFFDGGSPLFVTAAEMRYREGEKRFVFKDQVKAWQAREFLLTDALSMNSETGDAGCQGHVRSVFIHRKEEASAEETIEITADRMDYDSAKKRIAYQNNGLLVVKEMQIRAQSILVILDKESSLREIAAEGQVILTQRGREGTAERADYDLKKEAVVLTGDPQVKDKDRGTIRGDKLTFYLADDKITVENQGRERSVTVIKS